MPKIMLPDSPADHGRTQIEFVHSRINQQTVRLRLCYIVVRQRNVRLQVLYGDNSALVRASSERVQVRDMYVQSSTDGPHLSIKL
jgi:hypothetical protein